MTKSQIKAELRRSACEDKEPYYQCDYDAFKVAVGFKEDVCLSDLSEDSLRTFFFLVAEAL